jgi:hypothetical protein
VCGIKESKNQRRKEVRRLELINKNEIGGGKCSISVLHRSQVVWEDIIGIRGADKEIARNNWKQMTTRKKEKNVVEN